MKLNTCPDCGANLDPCERCDCKDKKKSDKKEGETKNGTAHANDASPGTVSSYTIISHVYANCKNPLGYLRENKQMTPGEIVEDVRVQCSKYDRPLLSKCEKPHYGIELKPKVLISILQKHAPELLVPPKDTSHRLTKRIGCRLEDDEYESLMQIIKAKGYATTQSWLSELVHNYINSNTERMAENAFIPRKHDLHR